ncbi:NmrA/HSCARG family protein [Nocardia sp. XZ_19_385]|uniref:NmrA/HSCARG family protein n=1 Tax=Nocardia sp. XZ_19_385 TaxID=2769488 RepID=UPI0018903178|nr:NmrA/HSCARG family protein [Nocardia sp. XZ_19_385]
MSNDKGPVLVIGATGQQGRATTQQLLERGWGVRAFIRDPEAPAAQALRAAGAELSVGDLDDIDSVRTAMTGAYGVFMMLTMMEGVHITAEGIAAEQRRGKAVVELAKELDIEHFVYSSLKGAGENSGVEYYAAKEAIEGYITEAELPATILRPVFFMDNFNTFNRPVRNENGDILVNLAVRPDIPMELISVHDIGAFAAIAFDRPADYLGRTVPISGDRLTPPQIAEVFGRITNLPAHSNQIPVEQVKAFDEQVGKMFAYFNEGAGAPIDTAPLREHHTDLMDLETWLRTNNWKP